MKRISPLVFIAALLCTAITVYCIRLSQRSTYTFEVIMARPAGSQARGYIQVFYDLGDGYTERNSSLLPLATPSAPHIYRLPIPAGNYHNLRFDPTNNDSAERISAARVVSFDGHTLRRFTAADFTSTNEIARLETQPDGALVEQPTPGSDDPNLKVRLDPPLSLPFYPDNGLGWGDWTAIALLGFAFYWILARLAARMLKRLSAAGPAIADWGVRRPQAALTAAAAAAVLLSSYPVIFLGKSFVSPNLGPPLLYQQVPMLPGYDDTVISPSVSSDTGSLIWWAVPASMVEHRALFHDGELPLWNRNNRSGNFLLGQMISMVGDPLHLLVIAANGASWTWDVKFLVARWLFALGSGLIALRLCRHLPSAMLATFSSLFIGFFIFRLDHPANFSLCYAPWMLYCWVRAVESKALRETAIWAAWLILATTVEFNSGTAKESSVLIFSLNFTGVIMLASAPQPWRMKLRQLGLLALAGAIFVLLNAPVWMSFLEELRNSYSTYNTPAVHQTPIGQLLGLFDEIFYHDGLDAVMVPSVNFLIMLGVFYFLATLGRAHHGRLSLAMAAGSMLPLAAAFGVIPGKWIESIPFFGNIQHVDNTFICVLIVQFIPLAAVGFHAAWQRLGTPRGWVDAALVLLLLGVLVVSYRPFWESGEGHPSDWARGISLWRWIWDRPMHVFLWRWLIALVGAAVTFLVVARLMLHRGRVTLGAGLLATFSVVVMLWRNGQQAYIHIPGFDDHTYYPGVRADFHAPSAAINFIKADMTEPYRVVGTGYNLFPGWSSVYGLEGINGADPLVNPNYRELQDAMGIPRIWDWCVVVAADTVPTLKPAYDFFNVGYYVDDKDENFRLKASLHPLLAADLEVYRSDSAWPRAFFTDRLAVYHSATDLAKLVMGGDGHPFAAAQDSEAPPPFPLAADLTGRTVVTAHNYKLTSNNTGFEVAATGPGVIVLQESWFKNDFQVLLNGQPVNYFRINHVFKGVWVDAAGNYQVTFAYWPQHFTGSLIMCGLGALLLLAAFLGAKYLPAANLTPSDAA